jgi:hypothetical protein
MNELKLKAGMLVSIKRRVWNEKNVWVLVEPKNCSFPDAWTQYNIIDGRWGWDFLEHYRKKYHIIWTPEE